MTSQIVGQVLISGLLLGGIYALVSGGIALIYGLQRVINFAHGEFLLIGGYGAWLLLEQLNIAATLGILIVIGVVLGAAVYGTAILPASRSEHPTHTQLLATIGIAFVLQNTFLTIFGANPRAVAPTDVPGAVAMGPWTVSVVRLIGGVSGIAIITALYAFLRSTHEGKCWRAVSMDAQAAALRGIRVTRVRMLAFATGTVMAVIAGVMILPIYTVSPHTGAELIMPAFAVVILGGLGRIEGAILAGLLLGVLETSVAYLAGPYFAQASLFLVIIGVLLFRPSGLLGDKASV